jgi:serine/threonine protein kinase
MNMQTESWDKIRELFEEVSRHPADERRETLRKLCPNDPELQNEILSLLDHDERAGPDFLTPPTHPVAASENDGADPLIGSRLGKCTIRRVIAAGGMGVVYEAEQENPRRIVAIKVMKSLAWSRMARRRFEFEVQSLARLTHPNIAQIYDAGTWNEEGNEATRQQGNDAIRGLPYFVMEYIPDARSITDYADRNKLGRKMRLELFLQACDAVHYGHQRGIIHRDLKPANILVSAGFTETTEAARQQGNEATRKGGDLLSEPQAPARGGALSEPQGGGPPVARAPGSDGEAPARDNQYRDCKGVVLTAEQGSPSKGPIDNRQLNTVSPTRCLVASLPSCLPQVKVIDFGVARATDSDLAATTQLTDVGQLIGTLRYMSPEQCAADPLGLDVRSDVYAIGVILYELLCGRMPYGGAENVQKSKRPKVQPEAMTHPNRDRKNNLNPSLNPGPGGAKVRSQGWSEAEPLDADQTPLTTPAGVEESSRDPSEPQAPARGNQYRDSQGAVLTSEPQAPARGGPPVARAPGSDADVAADHAEPQPAGGTSSTMYAMIKAICEEPPGRPSAADRSLRGDLEIILLKTLEKDREKRYQSVADLSRDIRHYLNREPIEARGPSIATSVTRRIARHPILATAIAAAFVGIAILFTVWITVYLAHQRPYEIVRRNEGKEAVLLSFSGNVLHTWKGPKGGSFTVAELIETGVPNSRRLALIGQPAGLGTQYSGKLCAFDIAVHEYYTPIWTSALERFDVPDLEPERNFKAEDFGPGPFFGLMDIFPQEPGPEIVLSYFHVNSRRLLRVLSLEGKALWQIWHDGDLNSVMWLPKPRLFVIGGTNGEVPWRRRGEPNPKRLNGYYPWVVWAIHPECNATGNKYVCTGRFDPSCVPPAWYKCIRPASSTDVFREICLSSPERSSQDDGAHVQLTLVYASSPKHATAGWVLDGDGIVVASATPNDPYLEIQADTPRIEDFRLDTLPPILSEDSRRPEGNSE